MTVGAPGEADAQRLREDLLIGGHPAEAGFATIGTMASDTEPSTAIRQPAAG